MPVAKEAFLSQIAPGSHLDRLFNLAPDIYFFVKNRDSRFVMCNQALLEKLGMSQESEIIGRDDYDYFEPAMAEKYREEDREVMECGISVQNRVWLVPNASGIMEWYLSSKMPLFNRDGDVIGLAGIMTRHQHAGPLPEPYENMAPVIDHINEHFGDQIIIPELASMAHLSVSQFERTFKAIFRMTPLKYINQVRIEAAARELARTHRTIADIAQRCGYYDHSYFTKQFSRSVGMTPLQYRKTFLERA